MSSLWNLDDSLWVLFSVVSSLPERLLLCLWNKEAKFKSPPTCFFAAQGNCPAKPSCTTGCLYFALASPRCEAFASAKSKRPLPARVATMCCPAFTWSRGGWQEKPPSPLMGELLISRAAYRCRKPPGLWPANRYWTISTAWLITQPFKSYPFRGLEGLTTSLEACSSENIISYSVNPST